MDKFMVVAVIINLLLLTNVGVEAFVLGCVITWAIYYVLILRS